MRAKDNMDNVFANDHTVFKVQIYKEIREQKKAQALEWGDRKRQRLQVDQLHSKGIMPPRRETRRNTRTEARSSQNITQPSTQHFLTWPYWLSQTDIQQMWSAHTKTLSDTEQLKYSTGSHLHLWLSLYLGLIFGRPVYLSAHWKSMFNRIPPK